ncbi:hypothetical protein CR105_03125 [Massilia eurypsychrophila]|uniref:Uncharacterized protein n=1 Tax=Massilia eurypsychrophila TaxID=1485217 RepID=A0A2G8TKF5_9BURK|nr:hypothetical protein [Massilia eurypsychrophila]PIL46098.1 hypothetical protein CR105_03125 [Massilia eurypsychrophila]
MDWFSTAVGFVVGSFTGAAGTYLADKYTDQRRDQAEAAAANALWREAFDMFPEVMREMQADVRNPRLAGVRDFFVKSSGSTVNSDRPHLEYHTDVHSNIMGAIAYLEEVGYIDDITPGNCPKYRMRLPFVNRLKAGS